MGGRPDQVSAIGPCVVGNRLRGRAATGTTAEQLASHRLIAQSRHAARAASSQVTDRAVGPDSYTRRAQHPLAATSPLRSVACMEPDATCKHFLSFAFMVEELLALARRRPARHARAGRCAGLLRPDAHARAVGHRRRCIATATTSCGGCTCVSAAISTPVSTEGTARTSRSMTLRISTHSFENANCLGLDKGELVPVW